MAAVRRPGTTLKLNLALRGAAALLLPAGGRAVAVRRRPIHLLPGSASWPARRRLADGGAARDVGRRAGRPAARRADHRVVPAHHRRPVPAGRRPGTTRRRCSCSRCRTTLAGIDLGRPSCPATSTGCWRSATATPRAPRDLVADTMPLTAARHRGALRHHRRAHPPRRQHGRLRRPDAVRHRPATASTPARAGCHPAGSVIGAAGHNAAQRILADLGRCRPQR